MEDRHYALNCALAGACVAVLVCSIVVAVVFYESKAARAGDAAGEELCKDPEGEIEKLMEGQTVEKVTGEQAQEDAP